MHGLSAGASYLVLAVVGPDVVQTRGGEERRGVGEEFAAVADWEEHLRATKEKPASYDTCERLNQISLQAAPHLHLSSDAPFKHPRF